MRVSAIVVAAGKGVRLNSRVPKPLIKLAGKPVLIYSLLVLSRHPHIQEIIVVANRDNLSGIAATIKKYHIPKVSRLVLGGERRQDSVLNGLRSLDKTADLALIHDAARPFIDRDLIDRLLIEAGRWGAAVPGVRVKSTLKEAREKDQIVEKTVCRNRLWEIQTPQVFRCGLIREAFRRFGRQDVTDEAMLVEKLKGKVKIVESVSRNIKITAPEDVRIAKAFLRGLKG